MLCADSSLPPAQLVNGAYFIDANPDVFEVILDYLRHKSIDLPNNLNPGTVLAQAKYFALDTLVDQLTDLEAERVEKERIHWQKEKMQRELAYYDVEKRRDDYYYSDRTQWESDLNDLVDEDKYHQ